MSAKLMGIILDDCLALSTQEAMVAVALADHCDAEFRNAFVSRATLARKARCSEATVKRVLRKLREDGALKVDFDGGQGPGSVNWYRFDLQRLLACYSGPEAGESEGLDPESKGVTQTPLQESLPAGAESKGVTQTPLQAAKGVTGGGEGGQHYDPLTIQYKNHPGNAGASPPEAGADKRQACGEAGSDPASAPAGGQAGGSLGKAATAARVDPGSLRQRWLACLSDLRRAVADDARFGAWIAPLIPWREEPSSFPDAEQLLLRAPSAWHVEQMRQQQARLLQLVERGWGGPVALRPPGSLGDDVGLPRERHEQMRADALEAAGVPLPPPKAERSRSGGPGERRSAARW